MRVLKGLALDVIKIPDTGVSSVAVINSPDSRYLGVDHSATLKTPISGSLITLPHSKPQNLGA